MTITVARVVASLALATAVLPAPSFARAVADQAPSVSISYRDLDLGTDAGARALDHRVRIAAEEVCGYADPRSLSAMRPVLACRKIAMKSAAPQVEVALAAARSGRALAANEVRVAPGY
jgi:UrcA family protein